MEPKKNYWIALDRLFVRSHTKYLSEKSRVALITGEKIDIVFNLDKAADLVVSSRVPTVHTPPSGDKRAWLWNTAEAVVQNLKAGRTVLVHDDTGFERSAAVAAVVRRAMLGETAEQAIAAIRGVQPLALRLPMLTKLIADAPAPPSTAPAVAGIEAARPKLIRAKKGKTPAAAPASKAADMAHA